MYIDHASCSSCGARFQPEAIGSSGRCPSCGTTLGVKDLFGVADHLVEEGPENVTLNDLVSAGLGAPPRRAGAPTGPRQAKRGESDVFAMLEEIRRGRR